MKKIIVIGCPGSGKSTFSRELHKITKIPLVHLDMLFWNEDKTTVERFVFLKKLEDALKKSHWIIDGNYASTMEMRLKECDTVFFLDYEKELCLKGIEERRGKNRPDIPWVETEEDAEFINFIERFNTQSRPQIIELLEKYSDKKLFVFKNREEADKFLRDFKININQ